MTTCAAKVRATPAGQIEVVPGGIDVPAYGAVEIAWYQDRLEITALGAGRASITEALGRGEDVVVEIRPPTIAELPETVPGAD
jgi:hypothetical protein